MATEDLFLFVNPKSGGNKGQDFLKVPQPFITPAEDGHPIALHIFSLIDAAQRQAGFLRLKQAADAQSARGQRVKAIVGGGDGTVMWADTEATKAGIDTPSQISFGIVPLGTGNDFSRVAGWGGKNPKKILDNDYAVLRRLASQWSKATPRPHDVWQVEVEVDEHEGKILKVSGTNEAEQQEKSLSASMINYFSVGQESKVGLDFDKHRTKSQTCNLLVYACSGFSQEMKCTSIQHVSDLVSNMHAGTDADAPLIFGYDEEHHVPEITGNPESLMFLNVNSYAGGLGHFWQRKADCGIHPEPKSEDVDVDADPGDGRLEVVTLPCIANIALDKIHHLARRVFSGGPYYLEFFGPPSGVEALHAYCEIDGEFYHLVNPLSVGVNFLKRLQVLQNHDDNDKADWQKWLSPNVWAPPTQVSLPQAKDLTVQLAAAPQMLVQQTRSAITSATHAIQSVLK